MGRSITQRMKIYIVTLAAFAISFIVIFGIPARGQSVVALLNVSYDTTRELYRDVNSAFAIYWKKEKGQSVVIRQSHGGSGAQARTVIDGLSADVVTLALGVDIDAIATRTGKIPPDWQSRLPNQASPYTSTIVFLVRKGNPKGIRNWDDLVKPGIAVITPNPKTSGGARWNYLAAWAFAKRLHAGDESKIRDFVARLFRNVPVLDTGARASTTTFAQRGLGDVLLAWENEAYLALREFGSEKFEIVTPPFSILAEPPVALVEGNAGPKGTQDIAKAYLDFLYTPAAQALIAAHYYRPALPQYAKPEDLNRFQRLDLVTIRDFGGWSNVQGLHFSESGVFDQIYKPAR
jgi:sulfate/thiosulfate transport system substrate-binding protein